MITDQYLQQPWKYRIVGRTVTRGMVFTVNIDGRFRFWSDESSTFVGYKYTFKDTGTSKIVRSITDSCWCHASRYISWVLHGYCYDCGCSFRPFGLEGLPSMTLGFAVHGRPTLTLILPNVQTYLRFLFPFHHWMMQQWDDSRQRRRCC